MRFAFAALLALGAPAAARADSVDRRLNEEMPAIKKYLDAKGYRNVGVLRFRVQKGKEKARFDNAPFNGNLAVRLENLLVIHAGPEEKSALGVLHDAGRAATRAGVGDWFGDEEERKKLFAVACPLAWGKKTAKAGAFLTGLVRVDEGAKKTTFTVRCFSKNDLAPKDVAEFTLATDRDILRDLGISFVVPRKGREAKEPGPRDVAGVEVTALVNGKPVALGQAKDGWQLECPPQGKPFAIRLRNTTKGTVGVVVKVNGVSTYAEETQEAERCRKWVIRAGKVRTVKGFYEPDGEKLALSPFEVLVGDEAKKARAELGERAGLIEVDVFAEGAAAEEEEVAVSLRGLSPSREGKDRGSYAAVRKALLCAANLKDGTAEEKTDNGLVKREVIRPAQGEKKSAEKFEGVVFESHFAARLAVRITPRE